MTQKDAQVPSWVKKKKKREQTTKQCSVTCSVCVSCANFFVVYLNFQN